MEKNLNFYREKIKNIAKKLIQKKYGDSIKNYHRHKIFDLLYSRNTKFTIKYKEEMIYNNMDEYNKSYYKQNESIIKLSKILKYYLNYLTFFCRPIFAQFYYNNILQNYYDIQADIFYRKNYLKKGEKSKYLNNISNNDDEENKNSNSLSEKYCSLIFDNKTRKFIETPNNIITSINIDNDDRNNDSYIKKIHIRNNNYITIKNSNDKYLFDLVNKINSKRKEEKAKNKNLNIKVNHSLSQGRKKTLKKKKLIKKNKIVSNSNKNTIENNICTNYNITKTISKRKNHVKEIYNGIILNNKINLSDIKIKCKNNNNSLKRGDKSQITKNKYISGSGKGNINNLKKKIIKKISVNINNIKPGVFNLYKRSSLNIKFNNLKSNINNFLYKKTSFSLYKNNSIINSHSNIYNRIYNSNSNSPINKQKNLNNENKSDFFNFTRKSKPKKIEIKKNLNNNITNYLSNKKNLQKQIIKFTNNYNLKNNNFLISNNTHCSSNLNKNHKNRIYIALYKKTSNNNSLNKNQNKSKNAKNKNNNEFIYKKKYLGNHEHNNLLINYLANYFNLKFLKNKSLIKVPTKVALNNPENLQTFSVRIKKPNKNHSTSGFLNMNKQYLNNNNFSFNCIGNSNKNNNTTFRYNRAKNSFIKKKLFKFCNNTSIDKFSKNLNFIPNVKLLYKKPYNIDKERVNLNVNFNLNNINININGSSSNNNNTSSNINNNVNHRILDKLNLNNHSNFNILNNNGNQTMRQNKELNNNNLNNGNLNNKNYYLCYKSRNKIHNKISKKNIEKLINNFNFNIKNIQNHSRIIDNLINNNKNSFSNYKNNIAIKNKLKNNNSFSKSGFNKTITLINKKQIIQEKTKKVKDDNKRINSFIQNKRNKEINSYKNKENIHKYVTLIKKK